LRLQQGHLEELQVQNDQILDASVTVIARKTCINNLRLIDDAKQLWAADNDKAETVRPTVKDLLPYFKDRVFPECPGGGTIYLNAVNEVPTCSVSGHALPQ
jgi:bisphosphoglycerate-dependent phosphoglycerate mutase